MFTLICCPFALSSLSCGRHLIARKFFRMARLQDSRVLFPKSVKKSVELGVRVLRARNARPLHVLHGHPHPPVALSVFSLVPRALKLLLMVRSQRIKQGSLNNTFQLEFCGYCNMLYMCISIYYVSYWTSENYD